MNLGALGDLLPGIRKSLTAYRMVNKDLMAAMDEIGPSLQWGGRYNPKNEFGVLYMSLSSQCCLKEKLKQAGIEGSLPPQALGRFDISIEHCLDLTEETNLAKLDTDYGRLVTPYDLTEPQTIAREARRIGFEAILAPSAVGAECTNLVVFKDKLGRKSYCELKDIKPYKV